MTHDELKAWAHGKYQFPSLTMSVAERDAYDLTQYALALSVKLEAAHADRDAANQAATRMAREAAMVPGGNACPSCHTLLLVRGETAQPEVIKACPQCSCMREKDLVSPMADVPGDDWHCCRCGHDFAEPAYYQRVPRPQE